MLIEVRNKRSPKRLYGYLDIDDEFLQNRYIIFPYYSNADIRNLSIGSSRIELEISFKYNKNTREYKKILLADKITHLKYIPKFHHSICLCNYKI